MRCSTRQVKSRSGLSCCPVPRLPYHSPEKSKMPLNLGDVFPNFTVDTTEGRLTFHDFLGDRCSCRTSSDLASVRYPAGGLVGKGRGGCILQQTLLSQCLFVQRRQKSLPRAGIKRIYSLRAHTHTNPLRVAGVCCSPILLTTLPYAPRSLVQLQRLCQSLRSVGQR